MADSVRTHKPLYRVFHLNREGSISWADIVEAIDDEDAIRLVRDLCKDHSVELWDRARFVAKVEPPLNALDPEPVILRNQITPLETLPVGEGRDGDPVIRKRAH